MVAHIHNLEVQRYDVKGEKKVTPIMTMTSVSTGGEVEEQSNGKTVGKSAAGGRTSVSGRKNPIARWRRPIDGSQKLMTETGKRAAESSLERVPEIYVRAYFP